MTTRIPKQTEVFYPETDGMPLPDGEYQSPIFRDVLVPLENHFRNRPDTRVNGNTFLYYEEGNPRRFVSPDCYVAFGVDVASILHFNTYRLWEVGKPPDFVLEIGSHSTANNDMGEKRNLYARLGIGEYWRFDSSGGDFYREPLVGEYLVDGEYRRFELQREAGGMVWGHSPALNLDLCWEAGRLRYYDPAAGAWLPDYEALLEARKSESARADNAEARADAAEARALELEAELQKLRGQ